MDRLAAMALTAAALVPDTETQDDADLLNCIDAALDAIGAALAANDLTAAGTALDEAVKAHLLLARNMDMPSWPLG